MEKPVWQMTGKEFFELTRYAQRAPQQETKTVITCQGVKALSEELSCCEATIYSMKRVGILDAAVVSKIGKRIVFDVNKAREIANTYVNERRKSHEL